MMNQPMMPEQNGFNDRNMAEQNRPQQDSSLPYPRIPNDTTLYQGQVPFYQMPMNPMGFRTPACCPFMQGYPVPYTCEDMLPLGGDWAQPFAALPMMPFNQQTNLSMGNLGDMGMDQRGQLPSSQTDRLPKNPDGTPFCNGECMK